MERDNSRKRTRDEEDKRKECPKGKKLETIGPLDHDSFYREMGYEFCDTIGVFDFPWLKEGTVFRVDEYLEPQEDMFSSCLYVDEIQDSSVVNLDQCCIQNSLIPLVSDQNFHESDFDGGGLQSFQVDDLDPLDCIWSCVIDQPLDNICLNKA